MSTWKYKVDISYHFFVGPARFPGYYRSCGKRCNKNLEFSAGACGGGDNGWVEVVLGLLLMRSLHLGSSVLA